MVLWDEWGSMKTAPIGDNMSKVEDILLENGYEGTKYLTSFDYEDAFIGVTFDGRAVYDYDLMVEWLMNHEKFTQEEAVEWIDYNTIRALPYMGDDSPVIIYRLE